MTALAPIAPKLGKLIRLFGSNQDGEVLGAVRAAERVLTSAKLDWHAVADSIGREPETIVVYLEPEPDEPTTWRELAAWCCEHDGGRLTVKERRFVRDMAARLVLRGEPTVKQAAWLRSLYARLQRGARP